MLRTGLIIYYFVDTLDTCFRLDLILFAPIYLIDVRIRLKQLKTAVNA